MPALNFQKQFWQLILDGTKTSTIRKERKDGRAHCKPDDTLKLYTGMRTKQCELISEVRATSVREITLDASYGDGMIVTMWPTLPYPATSFLARMEGFRSPESMRDWFIKHHAIDQQPFTGWHIQWEAL